MMTLAMASIFVIRVGMTWNTVMMPVIATSGGVILILRVAKHT